MTAPSHLSDNLMLLAHETSLLVRTAAQGIIENDGSEEDRASSRIGYRQLLAALGIDGDEQFHARGKALRAFMPALREGCEGLLARAPGLLD